MKKIIITLLLALVELTASADIIRVVMTSRLSY